MRPFAKYLLFAAFAPVFCACTQANYKQVRRGTAARTGVPTSGEVAALTRHTVAADREAVFDALLRLLQAEGCLIESADRASGLIAARQMLCDRDAFGRSMGQIRTLSFLVLPAGGRSEIRLTVYIGYQGYSGGDSGSYYIEEMGMATGPEFYGTWFAKIDDALKQ